jgi:hypothetical protein
MCVFQGYGARRAALMPISFSSGSSGCKRGESSERQSSDKQLEFLAPCSPSMEELYSFALCALARISILLTSTVPQGLSLYTRIPLDKHSQE